MVFEGLQAAVRWLVTPRDKPSAWSTRNNDLSTRSLTGSNNEQSSAKRDTVESDHYARAAATSAENVPSAKRDTVESDHYACATATSTENVPSAKRDTVESDHHARAAATSNGNVISAKRDTGENDHYSSNDSTPPTPSQTDAQWWEEHNERYLYELCHNGSKHDLHKMETEAIAKDREEQRRKQEGKQLADSLGANLSSRCRPDEWKDDTRDDHHDPGHDRTASNTSADRRVVMVSFAPEGSPVKCHPQTALLSLCNSDSASAGGITESKISQCPKRGDKRSGESTTYQTQTKKANAPKVTPSQPSSLTSFRARRGINDSGSGGDDDPNDKLVQDTRAHELDSDMTPDNGRTATKRDNPEHTESSSDNSGGYNVNEHLAMLEERQIITRADATASASMFGPCIRCTPRNVPILRVHRDISRNNNDRSASYHIVDLLTNKLPTHWSAHATLSANEYLYDRSEESESLDRDDSNSSEIPPLVPVSNSSSDTESTTASEEDSGQESDDDIEPHVITTKSGRRCINSTIWATQRRSRPRTAQPSVQYLASLANMATVVMERPTTSMLSASDRGSLRTWRRHFRMFQGSALRYREGFDQNYEVNIREWVEPQVWRAISEEFLLEDDLSPNDGHTNNAAVEDFLLQQGQYPVVLAVGGINERYGPTMTTLAMPSPTGTSLDAEAIIDWRRELDQFRARVVNYRARGHQLDANYESVRNWVTPEAWRAISRHHLREGDDTLLVEHTNDAAIEDFLLCRGRYWDEAEYQVSSDDDDDSYEAFSDETILSETHDRPGTAIEMLDYRADEMNALVHRATETLLNLQQQHTIIREAVTDDLRETADADYSPDTNATDEYYETPFYTRHGTPLLRVHGTSTYKTPAHRTPTVRTPISTPITRPPITMTTDASHDGWAAIIQDEHSRTIRTMRSTRTINSTLMMQECASMIRSMDMTRAMQDEDADNDEGPMDLSDDSDDLDADDDADHQNGATSK